MSENEGIEAKSPPVPMSKPTTSKKRRRHPRWKFRLTRDAVIFIVGLIGIIHEAFFTSGDRPTLLILFAAMIGLPAFLRLDERREDKE